MESLCVGVLTATPALGPQQMGIPITSGEQWSGVKNVPVGISMQSLIYSMAAQLLVGRMTLPMQTLAKKLY